MQQHSRSTVDFEGILSRERFAHAQACGAIGSRFELEGYA